MASLDSYLEERLRAGLAYFSRQEAQDALGLSSSAFAAASYRLMKKRRLANPRHEFFIILRPEDQTLGAPDPAQWIDPLMLHQGIDYRISLLRAAAFHGSSHQAAMVFQVIVPKQLRPIEIGRHRIQFVYQSPKLFARVNEPQSLDQLRTSQGFAKIAGVELTLLDNIRYLHRASGIASVAQIAKDIGGGADAQKLGRLARLYENASVRRLGYLFDLTGHQKQADALKLFATEAKSFKPLDPSIRPIDGIPSVAKEKDMKWRLTISEPIEVDF